jgi:hypothetical protein
MGREEYFGTLSEIDRAKILSVQELVVSAFPNEFQNGEAALYAVGSSAVPPRHLKREPNDLDLRLVTSEAKGPSTFHEFFEMMRVIHDVYQMRKSDLIGDLEFCENYDSESLENDITARFSSKVGKPVDLFLPYGLHRSLEDYDKDHQEELDSLNRGEDNFYPKEKRFQRAYTVRLA